MGKISPLMLMPPLTFFALAGLFIFGMGRDDPDALPLAQAGKPAPIVNLIPLGEGPHFEDALLRAPGVKLVNFWASWCAPCRAEHAQLEEMAASGIAIYGINYKDEPQKALGFLAELGNPFAALGADPEARNALDWGLYGVPETYVIDGNGVVTFRFAGPITASIMKSTILPEIAEAEAAPQ